MNFHNLLPESLKIDLRPLGFGLKFIPRPKEPASVVYHDAIKDLIERIRIYDFFRDSPDGDRHYDPKLRIPRSNWLPDANSGMAMELCERIKIGLTYHVHYRRVPLQSEDRIARFFKSVRANPAIKICQSDKNAGLVAMSIQDYHRMVISHLANDEIYEPICHGTEEPTWTAIQAGLYDLHLALLSLLRTQRESSPQAVKFIRTTTAVLPVFHTLPKLHKPGKTGRPIVGATAWITTKWSIFLDSKLLDYQCDFALKNHDELIASLENSTLPVRSFLVTADVASLYTNMHIDRLVAVIEQKTNNPFWAKILKFICDSNYFKYGSTIFKQKDGIAMGTNCAVQCANIYLDAFDHQFAPRCRYYRRFVDDVFFIFDGDEEDLTRLQQEMNGFIPDIALSFESSNESVNFLDLTIYRSEDDRIWFSTYQKTISVFQYLPPVSCHPRSTISGFIKGELIRYARTNTDLGKRKAQCLLFYHRLIARGYSHARLGPVFMTVDLNQRNRQVVPSERPKIMPLIIPYYDHQLARDLVRSLHELDIQPAFARLNLRLLVAFKKNANALSLSSRSNISPEQESLLLLDERSAVDSAT